MYKRQTSTDSTAASGSATAATGVTVQVGPNPETLDPALNSAIDGANMLITAFEGLSLIHIYRSGHPGGIHRRGDRAGHLRRRIKEKDSPWMGSRKTCCPSMGCFVFDMRFVFVGLRGGKGSWRCSLRKTGCESANVCNSAAGRVGKKGAGGTC